MWGGNVCDGVRKGPCGWVSRPPSSLHAKHPTPILSSSGLDNSPAHRESKTRDCSCGSPCAARVGSGKRRAGRLGCRRLGQQKRWLSPLVWRYHWLWAGRELSVEQGGKGPNSRWRPPLTIKAGPVREVGSVEGLRLWAHHLVNLEERTDVTSLPSAVPTHPPGPGGTQGRQALTRGRPSPARAQLTVASFSLSAEATGLARLVGGKMGPLQLGHW